MNKFLTKLVGAFLGLSMVTSVGTVIGVESARTSAVETKAAPSGAITDYTKIVAGDYYIGATTGSTDYYLSVDGSKTSASIAGTAVSSKASATIFTFAGSGTSWTIKFKNYDYYLGLKNSKDNGKVQVIESPQTFIASAKGSKTDQFTLAPNDNYAIEKNNSGSQFGSYGKTQTGIWLLSAGSSKSLESISVAGAMTKTEYTTIEVWKPDGLTVTAHYNDESTEDVTSEVEWSYSPSTPTIGTTSVVATATYKDKSASSNSQSVIVSKSDKEFCSIDFSAQGYENQQVIESAVIDDNISVSFDKGSNTNAPKYYTSGTAIRAYGGNTFTVSAKDGTIISITLTFGSGDSANPISTNIESYEEPTWTGSSRNVTFTIGGTSGNRRILGISVAYNPSSEKTLESISVLGEMEKKEYFAGENWDPTGLSVTAFYDDSSTEDVTSEVEWSYSPSTTTIGVTSVTATATFKEKTANSDAQSVTIIESVIYTKILDLNDLEVGKEYLIGNIDGTFIMSVNQKTNNRGAVSAFTSEGNVFYKSEMQKLILLPAEGGKYAFYDADRVSLLIDSSTEKNSYLLTDGVYGSENAYATVSFEDNGKAVISFDNEYRSLLRFNSSSAGNELFSCYASGQSDVALYKSPDSVTSVGEVWAQDFLDNCEIVCDPQGIKPLDSGDWDDIASEFTLDKYNSAEMLMAKYATARSGSKLESAFEKYDYIIGKYNYTNFLGRNTPVSPRINYLPENMNGNSVSVIVIVTLFGLTATGAFFYIRRRRQHN